jgi:hypothetical protein
VDLLLAGRGRASIPAMTRPETSRLAGRMRDQALAFLGSLDADQLKDARPDFGSDDRFDWHYIPRARKGLPFARMTGPQRSFALGLLALALSERGYSKAEAIRQLELVLRVIEGGSKRRDPELYYFTIFGQPGPDAPWGFRYEGHHVSLNWTIIGDAAWSNTPQFFGANPAEVLDGPAKGTRVLAAEEDLGRTLVHSLDRTQTKLAVISDDAPSDVISAASRRAAMLEDRGIGPGTLNATQEGVLMKIIEEHARAVCAPLAELRLERLRNAGFARVRFAWMGGIERRQPHYYRVQGPTFLLEYDNTQNGANHVHVVFRDFNRDFGLDLLEEHYRRAPHDKPAK